MATAAIDGLMQPWGGPIGGVPPFDLASPPAIEAAAHAAIERKRDEIRHIVASAQPPTFANTVEALEDAGRALRRLETISRACATTRNDAAMRAVQLRLVPLFSLIEDEIAGNEVLFARVAAVAEEHGLTQRQRRLVAMTRNAMTQRGAGLPLAARARLAAINARLAVLQATFAQGVLTEHERRFVVVKDAAQLDGLDAATVAAAADAAYRLGRAGLWAFTADRASATAVVVGARDRGVRENVWRMWTERGAIDNAPVSAEMLKLRGELARLLGFTDYAASALDGRMARTPHAATALLSKLWNHTRRIAAEQSRTLELLARADGLEPPLQPWDRPFYAERLRRERFGFDETAVMPYLSLRAMLDAVFWAAGRQYDLHFSEATGVPRTHPDVRTFEVTRNGEPLGALWFDPFTRPGKSAAGWMDEYRAAESFRGRVPPLVAVQLGEIKPEHDGVALLTWDSARMLFHEMGHALHALLSDVEYPTLGMMRVSRDMIEVPSQLNERCLEEPALLARFARHYRTGEPMPDALRAGLAAARSFDVARPLEAIASAILDLRLHQAADGSNVDAAKIENAVRAELDMPSDIDFRHRIGHFTHIFSDERYAAGYYAYFWSEMMVADAAEHFATAPDGMFDATISEKFRVSILGVGNAIDPNEAFRRFLGRDPDPQALMRRIGVSLA